MKFIFKNQEYQNNAVDSVVNVFQGQPFERLSQYTRDLGSFSKQEGIQMYLPGTRDDETELLAARGSDDDYAIGFSNAELQLSDAQLLMNIQAIQARNNISQDNHLVKKYSSVELDVEMETGTGKTFVYIKTMFELNKKYGFSKFIVVVPSIAIREGVYKSFQQTQDYFMDLYGKKARFFIYNSKRLTEIDSFASDSSIEVMIINVQAFNTRGKDARKIYEELDEFQSRRPIDVLRKTRPILIIDEPQKMGGEATQEALKQFSPLFTINYSATHKEHHNLVFVLDALDAYNQKLVKKIQVKGVTVTGIKGTTPYFYLQDILVSTDKAPQARMEYLVNRKEGIKKETRIFSKGDDIYQLSHELEAYKDRYVITDIDYNTSSVSFMNGKDIEIGQVVGSTNEDDIRRIQIRETIASHLEKEQTLFKKGIKVLSLFFIDEVSKYRQYDDQGNQILGPYGEIFEEEYQKAVHEKIQKLNLIDATEEDKKYSQYLEDISVSETHKGYFSIDKKGRMTNPSLKRGKEDSDDEAAYVLILKDKERLLSLSEPTRFIFSHSALREGWDNPNVFQICTLRHTQSTIQKRQEVGRGLRICVDQTGERMDKSELGGAFFDVNKLTVVANEEYKSFVESLQSEIKDVLYARPTKADERYFIGKTVMNADTNEKGSLDPRQAKIFYRYLTKNNYVDIDDHITPQFRKDKDNNALIPFSDDEKEILPYRESLMGLAESVYDPSRLDELTENGKRPTIVENKLNERFYSKEFQKLWKTINHKYTYRVSFDSDELIQNAIYSIENNLNSVTPIIYRVHTGEQKNEISAEQIKDKTAFKEDANSGETRTIQGNYVTTVKYDLVGKFVQGTHLTRRTIVKILSGLDANKFAMFKLNPEEFISKVTELINAEKASVIVDHITYNRLDQTFDNDIFNESRLAYDQGKTLVSKKSIQDYVIVDGYAKGDSTEMRFAKELETEKAIKVFAKLPKGFYIPTPMGNYSPDWAIVYDKDDKREIYFIAETKGSLDSLQLRKVEEGKINCAKRLFKDFPNTMVHYDKVNSYEELLKLISAL